MLTTPLVLAVDADPVGRDGSGNETYLRGIIQGLKAQFGPGERLILFGSCPEALADFVDDATSVVGVASGLRGELSWGRLAQRLGASVALGSWNAPVGFRGDIAVIVYDVAWRRVPKTFPLALRLRIEASVQRAIRRAGVILTCSEFSRQELLSCYPRLDSERVVVGLGAPDRRFFARPPEGVLAEARARLGLPDRFALAVGNLQPRKNLVAASEACRKAGIPLVVAGRPIWGHSAPPTSANDAQWLGYVDDSDLRALYRLCRVFIYPSLYEGFGLPVVEAMAAGAPVVCSSTSSLPEAAGGAALLVEPRDVDALGQAVAAVAEDDRLAMRLSMEGIVRAKRLSWDDSAEKLLSALRSLAASSARSPAASRTNR